MRYQNFVYIALSLFGAAKGCNEGLSAEALNEVNSIAKEYNITPCLAGDVYNFMNEAYKTATANDCNSGCQYELNKLKGLDQNIINDIMPICEGKCFLENMKKPQYDNIENESEFANFEKRATCGTISKSNVKVVNSNYNYGFKRYQDAGTVKTALSQANGCGPKQKKFGIDSNTIKQIPLLLDGTFEPACNSHDVCYACKKGKSNCDDKFLTNMKKICDKKYSSSSVKKAGCKVQATLFYGAVAIGGKDAYNSKPVSSSTSCAACGNSVVKNTLVSTPFYRKK